MVLMILVWIDLLGCLAAVLLAVCLTQDGHQFGREGTVSG